MEHRCAIRKSIAMEVAISYEALGLVNGRTANIGVGGMFVETGCVELPVNALVKTTFFLDDNGLQRPCNTNAMVVHSRDTGVGLMFNDLDEELHGILQRLIINNDGEDRVRDESQPFMVRASMKPAS